MARSIGLPAGLVGVLAALLVAAPSASATQFRVGGQKGWSVPDAGAEPYNTWAGRLRFLIGDQLLFVYPKETDSVLLVDAAAYNACNTSSYATRFDDGSTVFTFDRSGPFFFISGNEASCRANEKLIVVVLADRSGTRTPPPATTPPPPSSAPPAPSPSSPPSGAAPLPPPAAAPTTSPPPSPPASTPAPAPTNTPTSSPPAPAPTTAPTSSPPAPSAQAPSPSSTTPGGGSQSPSPSANAPGAGGSGSGSTTPPPPSASDRSAAAGFVVSLAAFIGYAVLAA